MNDFQIFANEEFGEVRAITEDNGFLYRSPKGRETFRLLCGNT